MIKDILENDYYIRPLFTYLILINIFIIKDELIIYEKQYLLYIFYIYTKKNNFKLKIKSITL